MSGCSFYFIYASSFTLASIYFWLSFSLIPMLRGRTWKFPCYPSFQLTESGYNTLERIPQQEKNYYSLFNMKKPFQGCSQTKYEKLVASSSNQLDLQVQGMTMNSLRLSTTLRIQRSWTKDISAHTLFHNNTSSSTNMPHNIQIVLH